MNTLAKNCQPFSENKEAEKYLYKPQYNQITSKNIFLKTIA